MKQISAQGVEAIKNLRDNANWQRVMLELENCREDAYKTAVYAKPEETAKAQGVAIAFDEILKRLGNTDG